MPLIAETTSVLYQYSLLYVHVKLKQSQLAKKLIPRLRRLNKMLHEVFSKRSTKLAVDLNRSFVTYFLKANVFERFALLPPNWVLDMGENCNPSKDLL